MSSFAWLDDLLIDGEGVWDDFLSPCMDLARTRCSKSLDDLDDWLESRARGELFRDLASSSFLCSRSSYVDGAVVVEEARDLLTDLFASPSLLLAASLASNESNLRADSVETMDDLEGLSCDLDKLACSIFFFRRSSYDSDDAAAAGDGLRDLFLAPSLAFA